MLRVKIIGAEDKQQKMLFQNVSEAMKLLSVEPRIITVTDWHEIVGSGIIHTPALVVRNQVLSQGFIPTVDDIEKILKSFLPQDHTKFEILA